MVVRPAWRCLAWLFCACASTGAAAAACNFKTARCEPAPLKTLRCCLQDAQQFKSQPRSVTCCFPAVKPLLLPCVDCSIYLCIRCLQGTAHVASQTLCLPPDACRTLSSSHCGRLSCSAWLPCCCPSLLALSMHQMLAGHSPCGLAYRIHCYCRQMLAGHPTPFHIAAKHVCGQHMQSRRQQQRSTQPSQTTISANINMLPSRLLLRILASCVAGLTFVL
jgi:hypothetical protein